MSTQTQDASSSCLGPSLQLTEQEEILCELLNDTCVWIERERPPLPEGTVTSAQNEEESPLIQASYKCEARIAGGWVRDKLLSRDSDDLDISLSTLTGYHFALYLKQYLASEAFRSSALAARAPADTKDEKDDKGKGPWGLGTISKIEANPEQSKNLETATAKVLGLSLDFVNLRKEIYDPASRIPKMSFGTPLEDAERRDITINSMFYNVHTRQVEDFTKRGLADLRDGVIRTPLPPLTTFLDDPLRILRCVRFASRFGYTLDDSIRAVLQGKDAHGGDIEMKALVSEEDPRLNKSPDAGEVLREGRAALRTALQTKVSRERFGIEVDKMMAGPDPFLALRLLYELEIFDLVFLPPATETVYEVKEDSEPPHVDVIAWSSTIDQKQLQEASFEVIRKRFRAALTTASLLSTARSRKEAKQRATDSDLLEALKAIDERLLSTLDDGEQRRRFFHAAALLPLWHVLCKEKKRFVWAGERTMMEGLKLGARQSKDPVVSLYRAVDLLRACTHDVLFGDAPPPLPHLWPSGASPQAKLLLLLHHPSLTNPQLHILPQQALLFMQMVDLGCKLAAKPTGEESTIKWNTDVHAISKECLQLIDQHGLQDRLTERPRLDGKQIMDTLGFAPGPMTPRIQTAISAWQFDRPASEGSVEECAKWLKETWEAGGIIPVAERVAPKATTASAKNKDPGLPNKKLKS